MHIDRQDAKYRGDSAGARALALAGLLLALATVCGAFGAHALKSRLPPERLQLWDTAVRYHFFQALGLLGIGLTMRLREQRGAGAAGALRSAAVLSATGVVLFCGSLYALALGATRGFGVLTPLGGIAWIGAWLLFAWEAWHAQR